MWKPGDLFQYAKVNPLSILPHPHPVSLGYEDDSVAAKRNHINSLDWILVERFDFLWLKFKHFSEGTCLSSP